MPDTVSREIVLSSHLDLSTATGELELKINIFINREKNMWELITAAHLGVLAEHNKAQIAESYYKTALEIWHTFWCPTFRKSDFPVSCSQLNFSS